MMTEHDLADHRKYLIRYAQFHIRDAAQAEDAVQETLMAAVGQLAGFEGRSSLRTWLTAILKRKIIDQLRKRMRESPIESLEVDEMVVASAFQPDGHWKEAPSPWGDPDAAMESNQFWRVYQACCQRMPERHALAFSMREVMEMSAEEICKELEITTSNLHVILFRARLSLRTCITKEWFGGQHA